MKNALTRLFDYDCNQCSPIQEDHVRKVNYDSEGNEYITFEKVDYPKLQRSLGSVLDWSLNSLLAAGVNPNFPIHTGEGTRLEGLSSVEDWSAAADSVLADMQNVGEII